MALIRFTNRPSLMPRSLIEELPERMRQMFEGTLPLDTLAEPIGWMPAMEIVEKNGALTATAELPGIDPKDVEISLENGVLTVRGEKKEERKEEDPGAKYHMWERRYGSFTRSFALPSEVDAAGVKATFENGILTIDLPKTEQAKVQGKKIPISVKK